MAKMTIETCYLHAAEFEVPDEVLEKARARNLDAMEQVRMAGDAARDIVLGTAIQGAPRMSIHTAQYLDSNGKEVDEFVA